MPERPVIFFHPSSSTVKIKAGSTAVFVCILSFILLSLQSHGRNAEDHRTPEESWQQLSPSDPAVEEFLLHGERAGQRQDQHRCDISPVPGGE